MLLCRHVRDVEDRLKRLEARTREQPSPVNATSGSTELSCITNDNPRAYDETVLGTGKSLPIAAHNMLASNRVRFDVFSRTFKESIPRASLSHSPQSVRNVHTATEPGATYSPISATNNEPTALCSSNLGFVQSLNTGWPMPAYDIKNTNRLPQIPRFLWKRLESSAMIPHRPMADSLLHSFFTFAHEFLPIFHRPTFEELYDKLWASSLPSKPQTPRERLEDGIFLSTLNVCFALGSLFSPLVSDEDRDTISDEYYERSRTLTNFDVRDYSSLSTVRLQLVTGLYLQTTPYSSRCWSVVGTAIRIAQDLGLDKDPSGHIQADQTEVEMRRRVWHACVTMDM
jgi:hypothetical protein